MDANQIEYINALAPFDHGVWEEKFRWEKITVGDRALFANVPSGWLIELQHI